MYDKPSQRRTQVSNTTRIFQSSLTTVMGYKSYRQPGRSLGSKKSKFGALF